MLEDAVRSLLALTLRPPSCTISPPPLTALPPSLSPPASLADRSGALSILLALNLRPHSNSKRQQGGHLLCVMQSSRKLNSLDPFYRLRNWGIEKVSAFPTNPLVSRRGAQPGPALQAPLGTGPVSSGTVQCPHCSRCPSQRLLRTPLIPGNYQVAMVNWWIKEL